MFNVAKNNRTDNRLEEYILENLERISLDQDYIDNLVFKLNHGLKSLNPEFKSSSPPHRAGYELTKVCSKLEPESIVSILKSFLSFLSQRRGVERNLLSKRFIKGIFYSKETVKINLFYSENSENSQTKQSPALLSQGRANFSGRSETSSLPPHQKWGVPQENKFVSDYSGCGAWIRTKINGSRGHLPTISRPRKIYTFKYFLMAMELEIAPSKIPVDS